MIWMLSILGKDFNFKIIIPRGHPVMSKKETIFHLPIPEGCFFFRYVWKAPFMNYFTVLLTSIVMWAKKAACCISNQGCHGHQQLQPPLVVSPEGIQDGNRMPCHLTVIRWQSPWMVHPEKNSGWENTGFWPQMAEVHIQGMTALSPDLCILPHIQKCEIPYLEISSFLLLTIIFVLTTCSLSQNSLIS